MYSLLSGRSHGAMTYTYIPKRTQKATREHTSRKTILQTQIHTQQRLNTTRK